MKQKTDVSTNYLTEEKFEDRMKLSDKKFEDRMKLSDKKFEDRMKLSEEKFEDRMKLSEEKFEDRMKLSEEKFEDRMKLSDKKFEDRMKQMQQNIISTLQKHLDMQTQWHANNLNEDLTRKITTFKDQIITTVDPLLQELETRRQDREIASYQAQKIQDKLDDHDRRLTAIEHS